MCYYFSSRLHFIHEEAEAQEPNRKIIYKVSGKGTLLHHWWGGKLVQKLWKTVWRLLKKRKIELSYDLEILLLGIYPNKTVIQKDTCTPMFTAALFTVAGTWKQPKCASGDEWIKEMWSVCTTNTTWS